MSNDLVNHQTIHTKIDFQMSNSGHEAQLIKQNFLTGSLLQAMAAQRDVLNSGVHRKRSFKNTNRFPSKE